MPSFENLRRGQSAACQRFKDGLLNTVAKLPTGYGKTRVAATSFAILRALDAVDVMVIVVPQVGQASQASEDLPRDLAGLGIQTKTCNIGDNRRLALRMCRSGEAVVFVVTVQAIVQSRSTLEAIQEITGGKRCFLVIDEYHHYGIDTAWSREVLKIGHAAFLAMSATPERKGEQPIFGAPHVSVSYIEAVDEGAVKPLKLHSYNYRVDFTVRATGELLSFTVAELIDEAGNTPEQIERWAAAREARWTPKYVSPLISHPVERLITLYANYGFRAQMIVYALCCSHARVVCEQVRALVPEGMSVDWVGTGRDGRTDDENEQILQRFCPPKNGDGIRPWSLHVLVCVGMAGEGMDICDAAEAVFLTSPGIHNTAKQKIGRLSRVVKRQMVGNVNVDAASPWAKFPGQQVMAALDATNGIPEAVEDDAEAVSHERTDREYEPIPDGPIVNVEDVLLVDIQSDPEYLFIKAEVKAQFMREGRDEPYSEEIAARAALNYKKQNDERFSATYQREAAARQLNARVRKVAGLAVRLSLERGREMSRDLPGDFMKRINRAKLGAFGPVEASTPDELERQNHWVRNLEAALLRGEFPSWL
jgi:superfamily II DNA or RNA helicase